MINNRFGICMVLAKYPPHLGGLELQAHRLARGLANKGLKVYVLTRNYGDFKRFEVIDGIDVYRFPIIANFRILSSLSYTIFSLLWLIRYRRAYNIIHSHQAYSPALIGILAKFFLKKPLIVKISATGKYGERREIENLPFKSLRKRWLKKVDRFVAVNESAIDEFGQLGISKDKFLHIPNGVEVSAESSFEKGIKSKYRKTLNLDYERITIFVGRLSEEKGLELLIKAWATVRRSSPGAHLIILGEEGPDRPVGSQTRMLASSLNLNHSIHFLGRVDNVIDYLLCSDVFVLPSVSEGMSNALLEAMAVGLGIIAGDNYGNRTLIRNNENGILVKSDDINQLTETITMLLTNLDYAKRLGAQARETVLNNYSMEKIVQKYLNLYNELLSNKHR
jgi:glycosyltransferase involved in cell wall biosynthesis